MKKDDIVQLKNPKSGLYIKINRTKGTVVSKRSFGPWKSIPIIELEEKKNGREKKNRRAKGSFRNFTK